MEIEERLWNRCSTRAERIEYMKHFTGYSDEKIEEILDPYSEAEIRDGYALYWNAGEIPYATSVGIIPQLVSQYDSDYAAALDYEDKYGPIIRDYPTDLYYIDTEENRAIVEEYIKCSRNVVTLTKAIKMDTFRPKERPLYTVQCGNGDIVVVGLGPGCFISPIGADYLEQLKYVEIREESKDPYLMDYLQLDSDDGYVYAYVPIETANKYFYRKEGIARLLE